VKRANGDFLVAESTKNLFKAGEGKREPSERSRKEGQKLLSIAPEGKRDHHFQNCGGESARIGENDQDVGEKRSTDFLSGQNCRV